MRKRVVEQSLALCDALDRRLGVVGRRVSGLHRLKPLLGFAAAPVAGAIGSGAFAPLEFWPLIIVSLASLFALIVAARSWKGAAVIGWLWGLAYFALGLSWLYRSISVYGGLAAPLAVGGILLFAAGLALVPAAVAGIGRILPASPTMRAACVLPALWTLGELVRGEWLLAFGWLSTGYAMVDTEFAGWAPVAGIYAVTLVGAWLSGLVVVFLMPKARNSIGPRSIAAMTAGVIAVVSHSVDFDIVWSKPDARIEVRLIQPDLPVVMKITQKELAERVDRVETMSMRAPMGKALDLIIWPEGLYPVPYQRLPQELALAPERVAQAMGATVLFNAFDEPAPKTFYNALWAVSPDGALYQVYAKHRLVPLGEYVPEGLHWAMRLLRIPMSDQRAAPIATSPVRVAGAQTALQICYEVMFGDDLRQAWGEGTPGLVINTANLGWFGDAAAGQFTQMTRMRAKETARTVLQSLNNAQTAVIGPDGNIERLAGAGAQTLDATIRTSVGSPGSFVKYGHKLAAIAALLLLALGLTVGWKRQSKS